MKVLNKLLRLKIILLRKDNPSIMNQVNHHTREWFDMPSIKQTFLVLKHFHSCQEGNTKIFLCNQRTRHMKCALNLVF